MPLITIFVTNVTLHKKAIDVLKFHQSLACMTLLITSKDLNYRPSSFTGKHMSSQATQRFLLSTFMASQKNLTNNCCNFLMTSLGGVRVVNKYIGIDWRIWFMRMNFPPKDKYLFWNETILLATLLTISSKNDLFFLS